METQHTPGPWRIENDTDGERFHIVGGALGSVVTTIDYLREPDSEEEANARLIAAAPLLLKALEQLVLAASAIRDGERDEMALAGYAWADDVARAAIREARGEKVQG